MILSVTASLEAGKNAPIVLRGSYESVMKEAAQIGYGGIELHLENPAGTDGEHLKKMADDLGLKVVALGTGGAYGKRGIFLASGEEQVRQQAVQYIKEHIDLAQKLGSVVILGLIKGKVCQCKDRDTYFQNLNVSMAECVSYAEKQGALLVMEMINRYESDVLNTIAEGKKYIEHFHSPSLKLHLDTFHMNIEEGQIEREIRKAEGLIGHVHMADSDRWYAGHGHYDFEGTIRALKETGYDGAISLESYCYPGPEVSARESFEKLSAVVKELT